MNCDNEQQALKQLLLMLVIDDGKIIFLSEIQDLKQNDPID